MEKLNINRVPSKRKDRIKLLDSALVQLKREFVGLDDIIDQLGASVYAWYVTPEIITRPTIVSIWGMTGTGKTSVVKRLISLLYLDDVRISFDCGECRDNNKSISTDIMDTFGKSEESDSGDRFSGSNSLVFMFDEFQYARTINESGEEEVAPSLRPIWSILDSGIIDINDYNYDFSNLCDFIDELVDTSKSLPHIIIKDNHIESPDDVSAFLNIMFFHYDRGPSIKTDNTEDQNKPLEVLTSRYLRTIIRRLNNKSDALGSRVAKELISGEYTIGQLAERLEDIKKLAASSRKLDCSKSLVFILGNLDEAYKDSSDISPDIDADLFFDKLEKISLNCIPIVDVSGSMFNDFDAIGKALSIGHYLARCSTFCRDMFVTFSENPELVKLDVKKSYAGQLRQIEKSHWGFNTDFGAVMELLKNKLDEAPEYLVVLSDMEFDEGSYDYKEELMREWEDKGINTKIVWWNFNARNTTAPETDEYGNIFFSGYNPMLLKILYLFLPFLKILSQ